MNYDEILKQLSHKENVSVDEIEKAMQSAIEGAGLCCSAKDFVEGVAHSIRQKTIYSNIV